MALKIGFTTLLDHNAVFGYISAHMTLSYQMPSRRSFLRTTSVAPLLGLATSLPAPTLIKPAKLRPGDTIGLFCPAAPAYSQETVKITQESLQALGFQTKLGPHIYDRYGYLAGRDADRVSDLHTFFNDQSVKAVMANPRRLGLRPSFAAPGLRFDSAQPESSDWLQRHYGFTTGYLRQNRPGDHARSCWVCDVQYVYGRLVQASTYGRRNRDYAQPNR